MSRKSSPQNSILKILARKKAISVDSLKEESAIEGNSKEKYAISRSIKNMVDSGLAEMLATEQSNYLRITPEGKQKLYRDELGSTTAPMNATWDGKWRMIILDLPEERKNEREALRYLLKKAGFICAKNSVWVSPFPFEQFFTNIKKDLSLTTEMMIITTEAIDEETKKVFLEMFGK